MLEKSFKNSFKKLSLKNRLKNVFLKNDVFFKQGFCRS